MIAEEGGSTPFNLSNMGKVISNISNWRENLAENIDPLTYGKYGDRIFDAVVYDKKEPGREYSDRTGGKPGMKERVDLLNMVMGRPQQYNTIKESQYRPTKTKTDDSDVTYYTTQQIEDDLIRKISRKKDKGELDSWIDNVKLNKELVGTKYERVNRARIMAKYSLDHGVDKDGREYISYYDKWNLNPTKGKISDETIDKTLGLNSPEIYGRVYLDELKEKEKDSKNKNKSGVKINKKEKDEG